MVKPLNGSAEQLLLESDLVESLSQFSRHHGCTLFMTLFSAFAVLMHRLSGQEDFVIGVPVSGRSGKSSREVVGYLSNLLPVRVSIDKNAEVQDFLHDVTENLLLAFEHQDYTLTDLVKQLNPVRPPGRSPIVDVTFNLDRGVEEFSFHVLEASLLSVPVAGAKFDIDFNVLDVRRGMLAELEYNTDLFQPTTIKRLLTLWKRVLNSMLAYPEC